MRDSTNRPPPPGSLGPHEGFRIGRLTVAPAKWHHIPELVANIRAPDRAETEAATGRELQAVLVEGLACSAEAHAVTVDGALMALWGVVPLGEPGHGLGWLLTTRLVEKHPKSFWRACKLLIPPLLGRWPVLTNFMDVRHEKALRWGRRLGFEFMPPEPTGPEGLPFRAFFVR